ncbi:aminopeptidase P family protein [Zavarzinia sp. CC-PAN008]|uniref:aminopeptidase P family protein n=1 Tax=Zavarzinia sp. CC-PAN008 TaxID=3243332 RepID=UPI003F749230
MTPLDDAPATLAPLPHAARLALLRAELARQDLHGFLVPLADEHQGEYIPPSTQRLAWLTGFGGSAGLAIVLADRAAIFVDGRYTLAVRDQVDAALFTPRHVTDEPPRAWLAEGLKGGERIGYDPWLHTRGQLAPIAEAAHRAGAELVAVTRNPIDAVWADRPAPPTAPAMAQPLDHAGVDSATKRLKLGQDLAAEGVQAAVLTAPDSIAWLLNLRGGDVPCNPLMLAFAILDSDGGVDLFVDPAKLDATLRSHLGNAVRLHPPGDFVAALEALGAAGAVVRVDPTTAATLILDRLEASGARLSQGLDPCLLPKARKNPAEMKGTRNAHARDGAALTCFLHWLSTRPPAELPDELGAVARLDAFRAAHGWYRGMSFDTIAGFGPNGAIVHYRATPQTSRQLVPGNLLLVDSGAQYPDGTTDVTRTIAIGTPSPEHRDRYTRVLKGHIALSAVRFPKGTTGSQLDALARAPLWAAGLDYDHGTGHGVGSYLCVHEGPQRISKIASTVALEPGMIVSNEPGYYKAGAYGIRIENLIAVAEAAAPVGAEKPMLGFETLTLAPYDRRLVETTLLTPDERSWLNTYHARVRGVLTPLLPVEAARWLEDQTAPL